MKAEVLTAIENPEDLRVLATSEEALTALATPGVARVLITPAGAEALLSRNSNNRTLRVRKVDRLVQSLEEGKWYLSNDAITFDRNSVLANGQHRLAACVASGRVIEVLFYTGADPELRQIIDTGTKRTFADALVMNGLTGYSHAVAAATNLHYRYTHRQLAMTGAGAIGFYDRPNHDVLISYLDEHPEIITSAPEGMATYLALRSFSQTAATTFISVTRQIDPELSDEFIEKLKSGIGLTEFEPVTALRQLFENSQNRPDAMRRRSEWALAAAVKAWNYKRQNRQVRVIAVRKTETFPEAL